MIYSLVVLSAPSSNVPKRALAFARALKAREHQLLRVFFLDDGVQCTLATAVEAQDEQDQLSEWRALADEGTELIACVSSALRRGVLDEQEASRHERSGATLDKAFEIGGLGLLVDAAASSDRLITFGGQG